MQSKPIEVKPSKQIYHYPQYFQPTKYFEPPVTMLKDINQIRLNRGIGSMHVLTSSIKPLVANPSATSTSNSTNNNATSSTNNKTLKIAVDYELKSGHKTHIEALETKVKQTTTHIKPDEQEKVSILPGKDKLDGPELSKTQSEPEPSAIKVSPPVVSLERTAQTDLSQKVESISSEKPVPVQQTPAASESQKQSADLLVNNSNVRNMKPIDLSILKEKGFFQHYTICKYIDELPNIWKPVDYNSSLDAQMMDDASNLVEMGSHSHNWVN